MAAILKTDKWDGPIFIQFGMITHFNRLYSVDRKNFEFVLKIQDGGRPPS